MAPNKNLFHTLTINHSWQIDQIYVKPIMKNIVIIGGGPGGVAAAQNAAKSLSSKEAKITLLEKRSFFFHAPGSLRAMVDTSFIPKILIPYDNVFSKYPNVELKFATVDSIAYDAKTVTFTSTATSSGPQETISYDYLIIATGSSYPSPIKPTGAVSSTQDIERDLTQAAKDIKKSERILVVGGGAVGIEMAGELKAFYPDKKIMLLDSHHELLSNQNVPKLREPVKQALLKHGVELFLGQRLKERFTSHQFGTKSLVTEAGLTIESDAQLVCVGMKPNIDLMKDPECLDGGRSIKVTATMQVDHPSADYEHVFVLGDASNHPTPKLAYWAMDQGKHLGMSIAKNILNGKDIKPYAAPSAEALFLPLGPGGGVGQLPMFSGILIGNFLTRVFKSKDLLAGMFWKDFNVKMPA